MLLLFFLVVLPTSLYLSALQHLGDRGPKHPRLRLRVRAGFQAGQLGLRGLRAPLRGASTSWLRPCLGQRRSLRRDNDGGGACVLRPPCFSTRDPKLGAGLGEGSSCCVWKEIKMLITHGCFDGRICHKRTTVIFLFAPCIVTCSTSLVKFGHCLVSLRHGRHHHHGIKNCLCCCTTTTTTTTSTTNTTPTLPPRLGPRRLLISTTASVTATTATTTNAATPTSTSIPTPTLTSTTLDCCCCYCCEYFHCS